MDDLLASAEYLFEKAEQLQQKHPELYISLSSIFAQDPAAGITSKE
jgi:Mlc titration factor MtfA (ptsG expression regulator)